MSEAELHVLKAEFRYSFKASGMASLVTSVGLRLVGAQSTSRSDESLCQANALKELELTMRRPSPWNHLSMIILDFQRDREGRTKLPVIPMAAPASLPTIVLAIASRGLATGHCRNASGS